MQIFGQNVSVVKDDIYIDSMGEVLSAVVNDLTSDVFQDNQHFDNLLRICNVLGGCICFLNSLFPLAYFQAPCGG